MMHNIDGFPGASNGKESAYNVGNPGSIPWRREWLPSPAFLPGEFFGERSLAGYSLWGRKESDTTERVSLQFHFTCTIWAHILKAEKNPAKLNNVLFYFYLFIFFLTMYYFRKAHVYDKIIFKVRNIQESGSLMWWWWRTEDKLGRSEEVDY